MQILKGLFLFSLIKFSWTLLWIVDTIVSNLFRKFVKNYSFKKRTRNSLVFTQFSLFQNKVLFTQPINQLFKTSTLFWKINGLYSLIRFRHANYVLLFSLWKKTHKHIKPFIINWFWKSVPPVQKISRVFQMSNHTLLDIELV